MRRNISRAVSKFLFQYFGGLSSCLGQVAEEARRSGAIGDTMIARDS